MARPTRKELVVQVAGLRADGLTYTQIGERLDRKPGSIRNLMSDPSGSKQRARRARYQGTCVDCGGPTDGANGREKAPLRCLYCVQGILPHERERPSEPSRRRCIPVRLCDLPVDVRMAGAREANRVEPGLQERQEILIAALLPSETTYWIAPTPADLWQAT
jgi:hypothetical protein